MAGAIALTIGILYFHSWQNQVRDLMGVPRLRWFNYPRPRSFRSCCCSSSSRSGSCSQTACSGYDSSTAGAAPRVSFIVVVGLLLALGISILNGVVVRGSMSLLNSTFSNVNDEMDPNNPAPKTPLRSGGPGSLVSWESLGHQGRFFVGNGPTVAQLTEFNGAPAVEPIRAYAGLNSAKGIRATAGWRPPNWCARAG